MATDISEAAILLARAKAEAQELTITWQGEQVPSARSADHPAGHCTGMQTVSQHSLPIHPHLAHTSR